MVHRDTKFKLRTIMKQYQQDHQHRVALDIIEEKRMKEYKPIDKFDSSIFNRGMDWFKSGLSLEDAPEDLKDNTNFIRGFDKAKRINDIEKNLYDLGVECCNTGMLLIDAPENYRDNEFFIKGFQDAMNKNKKM